LNLPFTRKLTSLIETKRFAERLATLFKEGDIIVLNGNLGSGKTTLVRGICTNYDIKDVSSPSFSIVNEYDGEKKIYHFDFYRLKKIEELYDIGFEEYINNSGAIIFIEWGDLLSEIIPRPHYEIHMQMMPRSVRLVKIVKKN